MEPTSRTSYSNLNHYNDYMRIQYGLSIFLWLIQSFILSKHGVHLINISILLNWVWHCSFVLKLVQYSTGQYCIKIGKHSKYLISAFISVTIFSYHCIFLTNQVSHLVNPITKSTNTLTYTYFSDTYKLHHIPPLPTYPQSGI